MTSAGGFQVLLQTFRLLKCEKTDRLDTLFTVNIQIPYLVQFYYLLMGLD